MKIQFIGVGSAFTTPEYYQSNMLITARSGKKLLLDCGGDARFSLAECGINSGNMGELIDGVYISHLHTDHIGGLEWLAFNTFFNPKSKKPMLFSEEKMMQELWEYSLKKGLGRIEGQITQLEDYFACYPQAETGTFYWESIAATLVKMPHVMTGSNNHYSYGLLLREPGEASVFISTDTQFQPTLIAEIALRADVIFHDCETTPFNTPVHAHYQELCTLPAALKQKIWLYHYQPQPTYQPQQDGFKGFVIKGQEFNFSVTA